MVMSEVDAPQGMRWRLWDRPPLDAAGGGCVVTGDNGPVVDLGVDLEAIAAAPDAAFGRLCISVAYFEEIARGLGWVPGADLDREWEARRAAESLLEEREAELEALRAGGTVDVDLALDVAHVKAAVDDIRAELERRKGGRPRKQGASKRAEEAGGE